MIEAERRYDRLYELVDGVLVEKGDGISRIAPCRLLDRESCEHFVVPRNLGLVSAPDGMIRLFAGPRPDSRCRLRLVGPTSRTGRFPRSRFPTLAPDLVVEVLSESNTRAEMERKRGEYFAAGVRLVWEVDPESAHS